MNILSTTTALLLSTVGLASADECRSEWSIQPSLEYNSGENEFYGKKEGLTAGLNFVFSLGGSSKAECESARAEMRNIEIENEYERLELCLYAKEQGAPRLIAECRAEGFIE